MEKISYKGWPNCFRLSNSQVDLIITGDVGPRIIRFGFVGEDNEFKEFSDQMGKTGGDEWRIYGGHRLWHAPEVMGRTYFPDNTPIKVEEQAGAAHIVQPTEPTTGIQKEMEIRLAPDKAHVQVTHRLRNTTPWAVKLAPWALSVMAQNGRAIIPLPRVGRHEDNLLPTSSLALLAYTDMADPRWTWGTKYIILRQDPAATKPVKVGVMNTQGWVAYARNNHLFVKKFAYVAGATYPDLGSSVETFTNSEMLEAETLGPLVALQPGAAVEHVEDWFLFRDVPVPGNDADVDKALIPKIESAKIA
jgi:hypothetical protein